MNDKLKVGILQYDVLWHSIKENLAKAEQLIIKLHDSADLILLPEMFATGFTMQPEKLSIVEQETVVTWMQEISSKYSTAIAGSYPFMENNNFYNRLLFFSNEQNIEEFYDKRHLFAIGEEDRHYSKGIHRKVIHYLGWKIMPLICYDLRFPVWSRNNLAYDLLFYSSNWPSSRDDVWDALLKARAIENQAYVIGVNRIGIDANNISYIGNSQVVSPKGALMGKLMDEENSICIELDKKELAQFRNKFPLLEDGDQFEIK